MRKLVLFGLVLVGVSLAGTAYDAGELVIERLLGGDTDGKRIFVLPEHLVGGEMEFWWHSIQLPEEPGYFVFIDDDPAAEWEHDARAVYVADDGHVTTWDVTTPPKFRKPDLVELTDREHYDGIGVEYIRPSPEEMEAMRARLGDIEPPVDRGGENYALLLSGGYDMYNNHVRYYNNMAYIFCTLVYVYGYDKDNIYVLMSDGDDPAPDRSDGSNTPTDLDDDGQPDYEDPCTRPYVFQYMNNLESLLGPDDTLFIYTTDHGGGTGPSYLNLWNYQNLYDYEFADELDDIAFSQCMITMGQCHSGGFVDDVSGIADVVIATACTAYESSYASAYYTLFLLHWTAAVNGLYPGWPHDLGGYEADADADENGVVTAREAFVYADDNYDLSTPMYLDTSGIGEVISLWGGRLDGAFVTLLDYEFESETSLPSPLPGEEADIDVTLTNLGTDDATGVVAKLSSDEPDITVITDTINFGTVPAGSDVDSPTPFVIGVGSGADELTFYPLEVLITSNNDVDRRRPLYVPVGSEDTDFSDDVENGENGWTHSGSIDQWHIEDYRSNSPEHSWKCGGTDDGNYANSMSCKLFSPLFVVDPADSQLALWTWYSIRVNDFCYLEFGDEYRGWTELDAYTDGDEDWTHSVYDLSDSAGDLGQVRFLFTSNAGNTAEGFYFDDIEIPQGHFDVELTEFFVGSTEEGALLSWRVGDDSQVVSYDLYRQDGVLNDGMVLGAGNRNPLEPLNELPLPGGSGEGRYLDRDVVDGGNYLYYLSVTEAGGGRQLFGPVEFCYEGDPDAGATALAEPYPSPAQDVVVLEFTLSDDCAVELVVYDLAGRRIATLIEGERTAGRHEVAWSCADVPSGVYFYSLATDSVTLTRRLVVSR